MKKLACLLMTTVATACLASGGDGSYYGPFPRDVPVISLPDFSAGRLGVLDPTFQRVYRVVAWRVLNGRPLTTDQVAQVRNAFADKTQEGSFDPDQQWQQAREQYAAGLPRPSGYLWSSREVTTELPGGLRRTVSYDNCTGAGTRTAALTLKARADAYGDAAANKWVAAWVAGQDQVFATCADSQVKAAAVPLPASAPADAPTWFKQDRAYQQAAAHFYAGRFSQAKDAFDAIARDKASTWAAVAPYLAARALLRQGSLSEGAVRMESLKQAASRFTTLAQTGPAAYRKDAQALLQRTEVELAPSAMLVRLGAELGEGTWGAEASAKLEDLVVLLRQASQGAPGDVRADRAGFQADGGLTDWVTEFGAAASVQPAGTDSYLYDRDPSDVTRGDSTHACERAEHDAHRKAWTVLCYMKAGKESDVPAEVAGFASKLTVTDPAYATVAYHRARLRQQALLAGGAAARDAKALVELRKSLDTELGRGEVVYGVDGLNALRVLRSTLSTSPLDFLKTAQVQRLDEAARYGWQVDMARPVASTELVPHDNALDLYPSLPLSRMAELARDSAMPKEWADPLAGVAMARAAKLGQLDLARDMARLVMTRQPAAGSELNEFIQAPDEVTRSYILARFLGQEDRRVAPVQKPQPFPWLTPAEQAKANEEYARLSAAMADYYARAVLAYARKAPSDARLAVNLSEVVKGNKGELSQQAFVLLHKLFPKSDAAKRTKYWY